MIKKTNASVKNNSGTPLKGRGCTVQLPGRFAASTTVPDIEAIDEDIRLAPETVLHAETARSIVSTNKSPDIPFEQSINPYRGCEHGCVYCYARPTHSYLDLSPGLDFETEIYYKHNAAELLRRYLSKKNYHCRSITIGANTDPYQPAERNLGITRELLSLFAECHHPVSLITKGALIERDIDLLSDLASKGLARVAISIPTMNADLKRVLEPRVPSHTRRLRVIRRLSGAGIPVSVLVAPIIPALTDEEIESILEQAAIAGASAARYIMLRLPHEVSPLFQEFLATQVPQRAKHIMSLVRSMNGGQTYDSRYGHRQRGSGPFAEIIAQRFMKTCRRFGLQTSGIGAMPTDLFRPPAIDERQSQFDF